MTTAFMRIHSLSSRFCLLDRGHSPKGNGDVNRREKTHSALLSCQPNTKGNNIGRVEQNTVDGTHSAEEESDR